MRDARGGRFFISFTRLSCLDHLIVLGFINTFFNKFLGDLVVGGPDPSGSTSG